MRLLDAMTRLHPPSNRRSWTFAPKPAKYLIDEMVARESSTAWTTKRSSPAPGDRGIIWRLTGRQRLARGIVALAEVLTAPQAMADTSDEYWIDPEDARKVENRVLLRLVRPPGLP